MPYNGSGVFTRLYTWVNDAASNIKIRADRMDNEMNGFATGLSQAITKDGQTTVTANLPMATYRHTNVGNAVNRNEYATFGQVLDGKGSWAASVGGTADAITVSFSPVFSAYVTGMEVSFVSTGANTGAVTLNVDSLGAKAVTKNGTTALVAGDIPSGAVVTMRYDGTRFQLTNVAFSIPTGYITNAMIANATIDLTTKVTGVLPSANVGPAGSNTQLQFNNAGALAGASKVTYNNSTGQASFGDNTTAQNQWVNVFNGNTQFGYNLNLIETGHGTSKRAGMNIGNHWALMADINGNGTRDFSIYNSNITAHVLQMDTSGRVTAPQQPLFLGQRSAGNVTGAADFVANNVVTNRGSHYNTTTGIFTCPVAGDYLVEFVSGGGAAVQSAVQLNGTTVVAHLSQITGIISCIVACAANDQLKIRVLSGTVTANAVNTNHLAIRLLV